LRSTLRRPSRWRILSTLDPFSSLLSALVFCLLCRRPLTISLSPFPFISLLSNVQRSYWRFARVLRPQRPCYCHKVDDGRWSRLEGGGRQLARMCSVSSHLSEALQVRFLPLQCSPWCLNTDHLLPSAAEPLPTTSAPPSPSSLTSHRKLRSTASVSLSAPIRWRSVRPSVLLSLNSSY
jgi:hypothetical protein